MKTINTGKKIVIVCDTAEAAIITQALRNYDDNGKRMANKMLNEQIIKEG